MDAKQLALFPDTAVTGSGRPVPWPVVTADPDPEQSAVDPAQLALDDTEDAA